MSAPDRELLRRLDVADEADVSELLKVEPPFLASWRKRRKGPPYIRVGNAYLYPLAGLREYLHARVRADDAEEVALL